MRERVEELLLSKYTHGGLHLFMNLEHYICYVKFSHDKINLLELGILFLKLIIVTKLYGDYSNDQQIISGIRS